MSRSTATAAAFNTLATALQNAGVTSSAPETTGERKSQERPHLRVVPSPTAELVGNENQPSIFADNTAGLSGFLVPAIGFERVDQAIAFHDSLGETVFGTSDVYAPFDIDERRWYVPHTWTPHTSDFLVPDYRDFSRNQPKWITLWHRADKMPEGGYTVMVMAGGRRRFYLHQHRTTKHPNWWYRVASGSRDCFVVWRDSSGRRMSGLDSKMGDRHLYVGRSGRAVVYTRTACFANNGAPDGYVVYTALLKVGIYDRNANMDPAIKVETKHHTGRIFAEDVGSDYRIPFEGDQDLDPTRHEMIEEAMDGFNRFCQPVPEDVDAWRKSYLGQCAKFRADSDDYSGNSFGAQMKKLGDNWKAGLARVREAWQLMVVINQWHYQEEFMDVPGAYDGSKGTHIGKMLERAGLSKSRLNELHQMIEDFVSPFDGMLNYTGD